MMAIAVLLFFGVYLLISIVMVITVANVADKLGKNPWLWAGITVFVMYNLVFWDLIPTQIMHKHYCDTEAGFWVYKTPEQWRVESLGAIEDIKNQEQQWAIKYLEQWKIEHPGSSTHVIEGMLRKGTVSREDYRIKKNDGGWHGYWLNKRLYYITKIEENRILPIGRTEQKFIDAKTGALIAYSIDYWRGKSSNVFGLGGTPNELRQAIIFGGVAECKITQIDHGDYSSSKFDEYTDEFRNLFINN